MLAADSQPLGGPIDNAGTIALLGKDGGAARTLADLALVVASDDTARIQEAHLQVLHFICEVVEAAAM